MDSEPQAGSPGRSSRPGGRTARTRERVLAAVTAILVERGYDALTVDAVAERSGVHRTTVYRRWRDTGGLLADSVEAAREVLWEPPDTGSLAGDLTEVNREVAAALTGVPVVAALIAASFRSAAAEGALRAFWEDRCARAEAVVVRAAARGEVRADADPRTVVVSACAPVFYELALMRVPAGADLAGRYARAAAASVRPISGAESQVD